MASEPGLVEAGDPAQFGDRVEQGDEAAGGQDGGRVVGGLGPGRQADRRARPIASAISASSAASWSSPSMATVAPWSAAIARSVSAKATSGWNAPTWVPAAIAGARTSAPRAPLVWTMAWPLYIRTLAASGADGVVRDGDDDELDLLDERLWLGEGPRALDLARRSARGAPGRDWRRRGPASRPGSGRCPGPSRRRPPPMIPVYGRSPGSACWCGWV